MNLWFQTENKLNELLSLALTHTLTVRVRTSDPSDDDKVRPSGQPGYI